MEKKFSVSRPQTYLRLVEDTCRTFANIVDNFVPGEVYNVGSRETGYDYEELANIL